MYIFLLKYISLQDIFTELCTNNRLSTSRMSHIVPKDLFKYLLIFVPHQSLVWYSSGVCTVLFRICVKWQVTDWLLLNQAEHDAFLLTLNTHILYVLLSLPVWGRIDACTGCWWGSLRERGHWGDQDVDGTIILRWIFRKLERVVGTGWSWLRTGTGGGHLWVRWGTFGFHKCGEFLD